MPKEPLTGREWQRDKVDPYPEEWMEKEQYSPGTICGVLRDIYQKTDNDEIKMLSRIATTMAKKMTNKLRYYYDKSPG